MRRVRLGSTGIETSCIGFGCSSLGSRVAADAGLRAIEAAFSEGVTWFDLAPIYGGGAAEAIFAPFLMAHRTEVQICTKVGYATPPLAGGLRRTLAPLARQAVRAIPSLRGALRRSGVQAARSLPLTSDLLRGSLEASLRQLNTDYVDLYALHGVPAEEVAQEPILRALEEIIASGKARAVAVASDEAAAARSIALGAPYGVIQIPLPEPGSSAVLLGQAAKSGFGCITHSVFGIDGALARLGRRLASDPAARDEVLFRTGGGDPGQALARLLLERAFALNPEGVVLASMFSDRSRVQNLGVAGRVPPAETARLIDRLAA